MDTSTWPLAGLQVSTPVLTLRYVDDQLAAELASLAAEGIHDPATMPFSTPWTDVDSPELERNTLRHFWRKRAETTPEHWTLSLAVDVDGTAVGLCSIEAERFPELRRAATGSWLGKRYQRHGFGREARRAALHLVFAGFGADRVTTTAWHDNAASLAVTRSLPYVQTGTSMLPRRNDTDLALHYAMSRKQWLRVDRGDISLQGVAGARRQLQIDEFPW